jgi:hypothetical protein
MKLDSNGGDYGPYTHIVVVFNARLGAVNFQDASLKGLRLRLHPVQRRSHDKILRGATVDNGTGTVSVPGLTTAVFVTEPRAE